MTAIDPDYDTIPVETIATQLCDAIDIGKRGNAVGAQARIEGLIVEHGLTLVGTFYRTLIVASGRRKTLRH